MRAGVGRIRVAGRFGGIRHLVDDRQCPTDLRQTLASAAIGQKAVVTDPHQPLGQDVQQEAAHELLAVEDELFVPVAVTIVLAAQDYLAVVDGEDAGLLMAMRRV